MRLARRQKPEITEPETGSIEPVERKPRLGERLIARGLLTPDQLAVALRQQKTNPKLLGQILVETGFLLERDLIDTLAEASGYERVHLSQLIIDPALIELVPRAIATACRALPVTETDDDILLAMVDVFDLPAFDQMRRYLPSAIAIKPVLVAQGELDEAIQLYYGPAQADAVASDARPGVVRMLNGIISEAVQLGASDLHFEPEGLFVRLRYRVDGTLAEARTFHADDWPAVNVRLKIMAGMNIADTRRPQDGRFSLQILGREVDFRVAAHPTVHGENIVVRILDKARSLVPLDQLGYTPKPRPAAEAAPAPAGGDCDRHRPDRRRQDNHALFDAGLSEPARRQHHDAGGAGRIPDRPGAPIDRQGGDTAWALPRASVRSCGRIRTSS